MMVEHSAKIGVQYTIYDLYTDEITAQVTLKIRTLEQVKVSPWGDEILFIGDKTFAVPYPTLNPIQEIPINGYSVEYGNTPDELYYSDIYDIYLYDRKTGGKEGLSGMTSYYRDMYKIKNTSYIMANWQMAANAAGTIIDTQKREIINTFPLSEDKYLVIDNDKKAVTNCLDGTIRIWDLVKFIPDYSSIRDYDLYENTSSRK